MLDDDDETDEQADARRRSAEKRNADQRREQVHSVRRIGWLVQLGQNHAGEKHRAGGGPDDRFVVHVGRKGERQLRAGEKERDREDAPKPKPPAGWVQHLMSRPQHLQLREGANTEAEPAGNARNRDRAEVDEWGKQQAKQRRENAEIAHQLSIMKVALTAYDIEVDIETAAQKPLKHLVEDAPKRLAGENIEIEIRNQAEVPSGCGGENDPKQQRFLGIIAGPRDGDGPRFRRGNIALSVNDGGASKSH